MNPSAPASDRTATGVPTAVFSPEVFGKYFLVDKIAMGGMAEIFKAKTFGHGGFENLLVIKRILSHLSDNEQFVRMFMDEAKVSALLQNANIVRIYDFGRLRDNYFIAMEHVEGKDVKLILRKLAERRKLLPREFAVYIAMEAAKGLDYAHKRTTLQGQPLSIVHRDVSPSNLLVSYNGEVKVADFGIVKAANCAEDTDAGMLKGKFEYMSPEQASGKDLDRRSDIFSLGIILHEMLTGRRLFKSDDEIKTLERIKSGDVDPPSTLNPSVPARLDEIVMRALAKDPGDRFQDARELHAELLEFLYPASPDLTQQSLAHFMAELFADEVSQERARLEEGTRLALALHEANQSVELEPEWEEESPSTRTRGGGPLEPAPAPPQSKFPYVVAVLALLLSAGTAGFFLTRPGAEPAPTTGIAAVSPQTGSVQLKVGPVAGTITVDGLLVDEGTNVTVGDLAPGTDHIVQVAAEGYGTYTETVTVAAGDRVMLKVTLVPTPATPGAQVRREPRDNSPRGSSSAPPPGEVNVAIASFASTPSGADVFVDGKLVGKTPVEWDDGTAGNRYGVEYRLSGYETLRFTANLPRAGGREPFERNLSERAKAEGKLSVNVSGGWAEIYVEGKKIGDTPIFGYALPAGSYAVRARNDGIGLDQTKQVTVKAGETATLPFSAN
ncbi:MAG: serine/threonine-protein kinase [Pseudomonadota bacterium]|nr:serine/threonine-protein kinase [Pseudomonadota bacterium]